MAQINSLLIAGEKDRSRSAGINEYRTGVSRRRVDERFEVDPNAAAGEIVKGALDSELVKDLLGPMAQNLGLIMGKISDIARFYAEDNLGKIFKKWAGQRKGKPLDAAAFRRVLPLLRDAAMQSDDELQERWASLLENVATTANGVLPSFGQTLSQLTPAEARYLDRVWEHVSAPRVTTPGNVRAETN